MMTFLGHLVGLLREENGASSAEYALILTIITVAFVGAVLVFGGQFANTVSTIQGCYDTPAAAGC